MPETSFQIIVLTDLCVRIVSGDTEEALEASRRA
jgi:hypothetical protein